MYIRTKIFCLAESLVGGRGCYVRQIKGYGENISENVGNRDEEFSHLAFSYERRDYRRKKGKI